MLLNTKTGNFINFMKEIMINFVPHFYQILVYCYTCQVRNGFHIFLVNYKNKFLKLFFQSTWNHNALSCNARSLFLNFQVDWILIYFNKLFFEWKFICTFQGNVKFAFSIDMCSYHIFIMAFQMLFRKIPT